MNSSIFLKEKRKYLLPFLAILFIFIFFVAFFAEVPNSRKGDVFAQSEGVVAHSNEDYHYLSAPIHKIEIPIPPGWVTYNSELADDSITSGRKKAHLADVLGVDSRDLYTLFAQVDAIAVSPEVKEEDAGSAIVVYLDGYSGGGLPDEAAVRDDLKDEDAQFIRYERYNSNNGEIAIAYSSVNLEGVEIYGARIIIYSKQSGLYIPVDVTGPDKEEVDSLIDMVKNSWKYQ